jgi:hypothetical protein
MVIKFLNIVLGANRMCDFNINARRHELNLVDLKAFSNHFQIKNERLCPDSDSWVGYLIALFALDFYLGGWPNLDGGFFNFKVRRFNSIMSFR